MPVRTSLAVTLASGLMLGSAAVCAEPTASMLGDTCAGCHGIDGVSQGPAIPSLAGISDAYFIETMQAYKKGERHSTIMQRIAKGYTDAEIEIMAPYFSKKPVARSKQELDSAKVARGAELYGKNCEKCHSENGALGDDDAGILASQWLPYMQHAMADYKAGKRDMPKKMKKKVEALSDDDLDAILQFFASQQ
ncbi:MAG: c-type cytochrome [Thiohalobacterales bacterium]|nr:c-type cytochrome [Thiohalobacterales bacterium]